MAAVLSYQASNSYVQPTEPPAKKQKAGKSIAEMSGNVNDMEGFDD